MRLRVLLASLVISLNTTALAAPPTIKEAEKLMSAGKYGDAISVLRKLANDSKQSMDTRVSALQELISYQFLTLQSGLLPKGDRLAYLKSIKADYQTLLLLRPEEAKLYYSYGEFLMQIKETSLAIDAFSAALYLGYRQASVPLGKLYLDRKEYEDAAEVMRDATALNPSASTLWWRLGFAQFRLNDYEAAAESLGKGYQLDSVKGFILSQEELESLSLLEVYSRVLLKLERYPEAVSIAKKFLLLHNDAEGYLFAASIYTGANQPDNAIFYYIRALDDANQKAERSPNLLALVLNNYAWFFCTVSDVKYQTTENLMLAFEMSTKAVKLSKRHFRYLDTLAEVYYLLGYPEEAIALESEAIQKTPSEAFYQEQLTKFEASLQSRPSVLVAPELLRPSQQTLLPEKSAPTKMLQSAP